MLSPVLALAEAAGPAAGASAPGFWRQLLQQLLHVAHAFDLNVPSFFAQVLSFSVVAWVLWRFAFKPVLATMNERQLAIESGLKYAEEMKAKLAAAQHESEAILKAAQTESARIIDEARKSAKEYLDRQMQEATSRANDALAKAQQAIELEHGKMLADARTEIARLVVVTTERVLSKRLSDADRSAYNDAATRELAAT